MTDKNEREVKGVYIPIKLWDDTNLSWLEKCILAEIDLLSNDKTGRGCFASNEYLAKFFNSTKGSMANRIAKLRKKGYIYDSSFDGRTREIRVHQSVKAAFTDPLKQTSPDGATEVNSLEKENSNVSHSHSNTTPKKKKKKRSCCAPDILKDEKATGCTRIDPDPDPTLMGDGSIPVKPVYRYDPSLSVNGGIKWKGVLSKFLNTWKTKAGGDLTVSHVVKPLKALCMWHGSVKVLKHWDNYVKDTKPEFLSFKCFREKFGTYGDPEPAKRSTKLITSVEELV